MAAAPPLAARSDSHGATLLVLAEPSFGLVRFVVALRRGAAHDGDAAAGSLSACLELLLRGTAARDRHAFAVALERLGATIEAACGNEAAMLRGVCLARHLPEVWALLCEAVLTPRLDPEELARLQDEAGDALRAERDDDDAVADHFLRAALYPGHPLGRQPGGDMAQVAALTPAAVRAAHARICAEDLVVAFAGDVGEAQAEALAAALTAALPPRPPPGPPLTPPAPLARSRVLLVDKPGRTQAQLRLAALGPPGTAADVEAFWLGIMAFGGTFTSPFTRAVRDERGWSYTAHADFRRRAAYPAPVVLRSAPALADAAACLKLEAELWAGLRTTALPAATCEQALQYVLNRYPFEVATAFDRLGAVLAQELLGLPLSALADTEARLAEITPRRVAAALARHLTPGHFVAVLVAPAAALQAPLAALLAELGDAPAMALEIEDYRAGLLPARA